MPNSPAANVQSSSSALNSAIATMKQARLDEKAAASTETAAAAALCAAQKDHATKTKALDDSIAAVDLADEAEVAAVAELVPSPAPAAPVVGS